MNIREISFQVAIGMKETLCVRFSIHDFVHDVCLRAKREL